MHGISINTILLMSTDNQAGITINDLVYLILPVMIPSMRAMIISNTAINKTWTQTSIYDIISDKNGNWRS